MTSSIESILLIILLMTSLVGKKLGGGMKIGLWRDVMEGLEHGDLQLPLPDLRAQSPLGSDLGLLFILITNP